MKQGDILSTTEYVQVTKAGKANGKAAFLVKNLETGEEFGIDGELAKGYSHSSEFTKEEKVSRTAAVEILESVGDTVFTVEYNKKPDAVEVAKKISSLTTKEKASKAKVEKCMLGEKRTMKARLLHVEAKLGRSQVIDLELDKTIKGDWDSRQRQVDHRTISSIIVGGTKYVVK